MKKKSQKTSFERLLDKAKKLTSDTELLTWNNKTAYNAYYWTPFKLLFLQDFTPTYTKILKAPNQAKWVKNLIYFDPLCGPGINILEKKDFILGSPLIVLKSAKPKNSFDKLIFNDIDPSTTSLLRSRILSFGNKYSEYYNYLLNANTLEFTNLNCNDAIDNFVENFPSDSHALVFLDPESFQISWKSFEKLFSINCDILFLFVTQQIRRTHGKAKNGEKGCISKMNFLFGSDKWKEVDSSGLVELFKRQIEEKGKVVRNYKIEGQTVQKTPFDYHIFVIVRPTSGGNPWLRTFDNIGILLENLKRSQQKLIFDMLMGRQKSLLAFAEKKIEVDTRTSFSEANDLAKEILNELSANCKKIAIAGSIRRKKESVKDIEIVAEPKLRVLQKDLTGNPSKHQSLLDPDIDRLFELGLFTNYIKNGERYKQIRVYDKINLDLFIVLPPAQFGVIFLIRTGPAEYSKEIMIQLNKRRKFKIENGCLYKMEKDDKTLIPTPNEEDVYISIGWDWIPPEKRSPQIFGSHKMV